MRFLLAMTIIPYLTMGGCDQGGGQPKDPDAPAAPVAAVRQVKTYPHDPQAFTQGLVWSNGKLYESTGRFGESTLREVTLETGEVVRKVDLPEQYFAEGLTLLGDRLYQLTWQNGIGFIYDRGTFAQVDTFPYQGEGWGLTTDGTSLILSDGSSALRFLDPRTYAVTRTVEVKDGETYVEQLNELEWVKGEVWANVWHRDLIARIDPATGVVKGWLDVTQLLPDARLRDNEAVPNGIAYDPQGDRLFLTGKLWPVLFEVSVPGIAGDGGGAR